MLKRKVFVIYESGPHTGSLYWSTPGAARTETADTSGSSLLLSTVSQVFVGKHAGKGFKAAAATSPTAAGAGSAGSAGSTGSGGGSGLDSVRDECCLTLVYRPKGKNENEELNLEGDNPQQINTWLFGINSILTQAGTAFVRDPAIAAKSSDKVARLLGADRALITEQQQKVSLATAAAREQAAAANAPGKVLSSWEKKELEKEKERWKARLEKKMKDREKRRAEKDAATATATGTGSVPHSGAGPSGGGSGGSAAAAASATANVSPTHDAWVGPGMDDEPLPPFEHKNPKTMNFEELLHSERGFLYFAKFLNNEFAVRISISIAIATISTAISVLMA